MKRSVRVIGLLGSLSFALSFGSCGGGGGNDLPANGGRCDAYVARLHACGLIPQDTGVFCKEPTGYDVCVTDCVVAAPCDQLAVLACSQHYSGALGTCAAACVDSYTTDFTCRNGNTIGKYLRCDGARDCVDGSDEDGCALFTCKNGSNVVATKRCNQVPDCPDSSDEDGCPTFVCRNNQPIPMSERCDGASECSDGSDEEGCPPDLASVVICR
jgi:hypothetical protein